MDLADDGGSRFEAYVDGLASVIGHKDREGPLRDYCLGLMLPCERKSVEPLAAVTAPERVAAQHQSLLHFVGAGGWSDERVLAKVREMVLPAIERHGAISAWIIDDTSFPKQGRHSVGVARQYCGYQSEQLRASRVTSIDKMMPTSPSVTRATRSLNPWRSDAEAPLKPRSASMISMSASCHPSSRARWCSAYWSRRLSWLFTTWCGVD